MKVKVMTFNIHHGMGTDRKLDLKRIGEVISQSGADIIGLNEVDKQFKKRSHFIDQIQTLATDLNLYSAFSPSLTKKSQGRTLHQYGNGLLSRYPIKSSNSHLFTFLPGLTEKRSILETSIIAHQKPVTIYVTHLSLNSYLHRKQSDFLLRLGDHPTIIIGDWNMKPKTRKWKRIASRYRDVWQEVGSHSGFTYPSRKPRMRLDYIFISNEIQIVDAKVIDTTPFASDHLPVLSTLSI